MTIPYVDDLTPIVQFLVFVAFGIASVLLVIGCYFGLSRLYTMFKSYHWFRQHESVMFKRALGSTSSTTTVVVSSKRRKKQKQNNSNSTAAAAPVLMSSQLYTSSVSVNDDDENYAGGAKTNGGSRSSGGGGQQQQAAQFKPKVQKDDGVASVRTKPLTRRRSSFSHFVDGDRKQASVVLKDRRQANSSIEEQKDSILTLMAIQKMYDDDH